MSTPSPWPDPANPNDTTKSDGNLENPGVAGTDTHWSDQQGEDPDIVSPTAQPPLPLDQSLPTDTDKGVIG